MTKKVLVGILAAGLMLGAGCGGDGGDGDDAGGDGDGVANVAGAWRFTNPMDYGETIVGTFNFAQSGNTVTGTFAEEGETGSGTLTGAVDGMNVTLVLNFNDGTVDNVSGTVNGTTISGTWLETNGGARGTFTAVRL